MKSWFSAPCSLLCAFLACFVGCAWQPAAVTVLAVAGTVSGCKLSPKGKAFVTLEAAQVARFEAMNRYGVLYRAGKLTESQIEKVRDADEHFRLAFDLALVGAQFDLKSAAPENLLAAKEQLLAVVSELLAK